METSYDLPPLCGKTIAVWFSCGAASAVAAYLAIGQYGADNDVRIINSPVAEEDEDNRRFLADVSEWLGVEIESAVNPKYPLASAEEVWAARRFMSSPFGAPCTMELKKEPRRLWELENRPDWHVLGFTFDEKRRHDKFVLSERENVLPILIAAGITKEGCYKILTGAGLELPHMYALGYPNANCVGCVKASSPTYWNHVRKVHPEVFDRRAKQSRGIGAKLVRYKGRRIFLDELPPDAIGNKMKGGWDCGVFCKPEGADDEAN